MKDDKEKVQNKLQIRNSTAEERGIFEHLLEEIREIRASERRFYQKITDIYASAIDYNPHTKLTKDFFKTVQNKLHYAIHGSTATEVIYYRADSTMDHMGLTTWKNAPQGKIVKSDVSVAKNYLTEKEIKSLDRFVTMYLDYYNTIRVVLPT